MTDFNYIEKELAEKSDKKSIYNAYQKCDLCVIVYDNEIWAFEGGSVNNRLYATVKKEMRRLFPEYKYLYDIA